jgi:hypothetical protein
MAPDLILIATVNGEPLEFIARDVPAGVFFFGFQDSFPGTECYAKLGAAQQRDIIAGFHAWGRGLLCRAMVDPRLTPEGVQRLGSASDELALGYMWGVGYQQPTAQERERMVPPRRSSERHAAHQRWTDDYEALMTVPTPNIRGLVKEISHRARTAPAAVWRWPISTWIWTWRVIVQDDLKRRAGKASRRSGLLPQSDIMDRVGREA